MPFPVSACKCPRAQSEVHKEWFVEIGVEELDWPVQSPDLNTIEHLWGELEHQLLARPNLPTSVLTSLMGDTLTQHAMQRTNLFVRARFSKYPS
jgi:hypothetical protein